MALGGTDVENLVKFGVIDEKSLDVLKQIWKGGVRQDVIHLFNNN